MASTEIAKTTKSIPGHAERLAKKAARLNRQAASKGKTFEELDAEEKDNLLKELAVRFGLVKDS